MATTITQAELSRMVERIIDEAETQAKYNGVSLDVFDGLIEERVLYQLKERIGTDWKLVKDGE